MSEKVIALFAAMEEAKMQRAASVAEESSEEEKKAARDEYFNLLGQIAETGKLILSERDKAPAANKERA